MARRIHIGLSIAALLCSAASLYVLGEAGATRWTMAFNTVSILLILVAVRTRKTPPP